MPEERDEADKGMAKSDRDSRLEATCAEREQVLYRAVGVQSYRASNDS